MANPVPGGAEDTCPGLGVLPEARNKRGRPDQNGSNFEWGSSEGASGSGGSKFAGSAGNSEHINRNGRAQSRKSKWGTPDGLNQFQPGHSLGLMK